MKIIFKMSFNFNFVCSLTDNIFDNITEPIEYESLYDFSNFSIKIENNGLNMSFCSDIGTTDISAIENFVTKFKNSECANISFNSENGSLINYKNNKITFNVYTYKEGTVTDLDINFTLDEMNHEKLSNIFDQLLIFKNRYNSIRIIGEDDDDSYEDSCCNSTCGDNCNHCEEDNDENHNQNENMIDNQ